MLYFARPHVDEFDRHRYGRIARERVDIGKYITCVEELHQVEGTCIPLILIVKR